MGQIIQNKSVGKKTIKERKLNKTTTKTKVIKYNFIKRGDNKLKTTTIKL